MSRDFFIICIMRIEIYGETKNDSYKKKNEKYIK